MTTRPDILLEGVTKTFGTSPRAVAAVDHLDLVLDGGTTTALVGPSGCGKSTTLNMVAGLEDVTEGELWFDEELVNLIPAHRRDVAMVFQSYALYPHMSVQENIAFGLRMRHVPRDEVDRRVREAAGKLRIEALLERKPAQLSGGQRQRVALGRAMVRQPAVFLMDEPLSNLDAALRISMRAEIKHLHQTMATTFVYVTHDQAEALTLADRIVVMKDGLVQQIGAPGEIYGAPANTFVASFLGSPPINYARGRLARTGAQLRFESPALGLSLPEALAAQIRDDASGEALLGVRPEDVRLDPAGEIRGSVSSVLPIGSDSYIGLGTSQGEWFFRVPKDTALREGEDVAFAVDALRVHLFDAADGASLVVRS
jgi:multiple sugar transport system ATP-binding protein